MPFETRLTVAFAGSRSPSTTSSLSAARFARPGLDEPSDAGLGIELVLLNASTVYDIDDTVDRDGRFCNISRDDDFAPFDGFEDRSLFLRSQVGVKRHHFDVFV